MKRVRLIRFVFIATILIYSCQDIIVQDIEGEKVILLSPPDEMITFNTNITFWWEEVPDAEKYTLQVVSPRFDSILDILADTNMTQTKYENLLLYPGQFEWRVRAYNNASETDFIKRSFQIDSTESVQPVVLSKPANNYFTSDTSILFEWRDQTIADFYWFKLLLNESTIVDENIDVNSIIVPDEVDYLDEFPEGEYSWRVQALNDASQSSFTARTITIDRTDPSDPDLIYPTNDTVTSVSVTMLWERKNESGSPILDSLYIYPDTLINEPIKEIEVSVTEYSFTGENNKKYYWKVKSIDAAGNASDYSNSKWFVIQE